ncbi:glycosyltransferase family 1 protein [Pontibacter diazotrophicus]|uniref:Glycosyltransferase family 1 protein n=1 Tax=Pontibacter diazotrophicus TaxID=1400979 RepID=A0A3D8LGB0_9BACT|nr:glycosyltransferase family 1 protein [Pontibacter diazotrophicus]RDV16453.1 glycosyltransferase family 1 protein [Pontibacter diazotrophicus]
MLLGDKPPVVVNARFLTQPISGVQRFAVEICLRLKQFLPEAKFIAPKNILHKDIAEILHVEEYGRLAGHLWEQIELPFFLNATGQPLLINLCNTGPIWYQNKIVCIHDLSFLINPKWFSQAFSTFYRYTIPLIAKSSKRVLTVSNYSRRTIVELLGIAESNVDVIYNAVSEDFFSPADVLQNKYGNYILAVGSLDPRKNLKRLIQAYELCRLADTKLVIVGAGSKIFNDTALHQLLQGNPSVVLAGYLSDEELKSTYYHARLFVYPSMFEGFGIPPLEAMRCGCATVVSKTTSLPEVCGDASYYVDPANTEEIAEAIKTLLGNERMRKSLIMKGYNRSLAFSWEESAKKIVGIIEKNRE